MKIFFENTVQLKTEKNLLDSDLENDGLFRPIKLVEIKTREKN